MADLKDLVSGDTRPAQREDRGQLILVTGLALAVALVILVLLVNTAIFTENLASRDVDIGEDEVLEYRQVMQTGIGGIVDRENRAQYASRSDLEANVTDGVTELDERVSRTQLEGGTGATLNQSSVVYHNGSLVRQTNASRNFSDNDGNANWTMATDITDTRKFRMTVDKSSGLLGVSLTSQKFHVLLEDTSGTEWRVYVYEESVGGDIAVAVKNGTGPVNQVCTTPQTTAELDLTNGTLAGQPCPGLDWANGLSGSYDIAYRFGNKSQGTYNATLNISASGASVNGGALNSGPGADSPYSVPAVYDVTVNVTYETATLEYRDRIRVAPGEHDD